MPEEWRQERPPWCPHPECLFRRRAMDAICGGELPKPEPHAGDENTHRLCLNTAHAEGGRDIVDLAVNRSDLDWFRWVMDALDGKATSWLSKRGESPPPEARTNAAPEGGP